MAFMKGNFMYAFVVYIGVIGLCYYNLKRGLPNK